jgi:hypothetical protein
LAQTGEVVTPAKAEPDQKEAPVEAVPEKPKDKKKGKWKKWAILGGFATLALAVVAYIFVPLSNVTVKLAAEKKKVDFSFTADKANSSVDTTGQIVPARLIDETKEVTSKYPTTGKKKVEKKLPEPLKLLTTITPQAQLRLLVAVGLLLLAV